MADKHNVLPSEASCNPLLRLVLVGTHKDKVTVECANAEQVHTAVSAIDQALKEALKSKPFSHDVVRNSACGSKEMILFPSSEQFNMKTRKMLAATAHHLRRFAANTVNKYVLIAESLYPQHICSCTSRLSDLHVFIRFFGLVYVV